jgi:hypothetical protein
MKRDDETALVAELLCRHSVDTDSLIDVAIVRALARALLADAPDPGTITALTTLLPPRREREKADWSRLTEAEFQIVRRLTAKAYDAAYVPPPKPARSKRTRGVLRLRNVLDRIEDRIAASGKPFHERPTPDECHDAFCALSPLLIDLHITVTGLLSDAGVWPSAEARTVVQPPVETQPPAPPREQTNVIPLQRSASPFAGLTAAVSGGSTPPHVSHGPEYQT